MKDKLRTRGLPTTGSKSEVIPQLIQTEVDPDDKWMHIDQEDEHDDGYVAGAEISQAANIYRREVELYRREKELAERKLMLARREIETF